MNSNFSLKKSEWRPGACGVLIPFAVRENKNEGSKMKEKPELVCVTVFMRRSDVDEIDTLADADERSRSSLIRKATHHWIKAQRSRRSKGSDATLAGAA